MTWMRRTHHTGKSRVAGRCLKGVPVCILHIPTQLSSSFTECSVPHAFHYRHLVPDNSVLWWESCLAHCRITISILNLYALDASSNPRPSHGRSVFGHCHMASGGQKCPDLELTECFSQAKLRICKWEIL